MKCKKHAVVLLTILSLVWFASLPQAQAETVTLTKYFWAAPWYEKNNGYFYFANATEDYGFTYGEATKVTTYNGKVQYGIRVYRFHYGTDYIGIFDEEITTEVVAIMERAATNSEGYQSASWTATEYNLTCPDQIFIGIYTRFQTGAATWSNWQLLNEGVFVLDTYFFSDVLGMEKLLVSDWNVTLYTYRNRVAMTTTSRVYFGNSTYNSKIENMMFDDGITTPTTVNTTQYMLIGSFFSIPIMLAIALKRKKTPKIIKIRRN